MIPIFDGHLDLSLNALAFNRDLTLPLDELNRVETGMSDHPARASATVTFPELARAGVVACLGTVLAREKPSVRPASGYTRFDIDYATPAIASAVAKGQAAYYDACTAEGLITPIRTRQDLASHLDKHADTAERPAGDTGIPPLGLVLAMEGADPILSFDDLGWWWDRGLRSIGLTHYGENRFAVGTGADGPLTGAGRELLTEMQRYPFVLDLTHMSDTSFREAIDIYQGPVIASHNNCRALVPGDRQFTDDQIRSLFARDAVIGVALDAWMLYPGWVRGRTRPEVLDLGALADHIDHLVTLAGNTRQVAIGSDLDGGYGCEQTPRDLRSIADLQKLAPLLADRGYNQTDTECLFIRNWQHFFLSALPR